MRTAKWLALLATTAAPLTVWSAPDWQLTPSVAARTTYTSNLKLTPEQEIKTTITELSAGLTAVRRGAGAQLGLSYEASLLEYGARAGDDRIRHQLAANADLELVQDTAFVGLNLGYGQQLTDRRAANTGDSLNNSTAFTDNLTLRIQPRIERESSDYRFNLLLDLNRTDADGSAARNGAGARISLLEKPTGTSLNWSVQATASRADGEAGADDDRSESLSLALSKPLTARLTPSLTAGYVDNHLEDVDGRASDGAFWGVGISWQPGPRTSLRASYNSRVQRDQSHGLTLSHRSRFALTSLVFEERLSTARQEILSQIRAGAFICPEIAISLEQCRFAGPDEPVNPLPDEEVIEVAVPVALSTTGPFIQRSGRLNLAGGRGKSRLTWTLSLLERDFTATDIRERELGSALGWSYRIGRRSNLSAQLGWNRLEVDNSADLVDYSASLGWNHRMTRTTSLSASLSHRRRTSDDPGEEYDELALSLGIRSQF